MFSRDVVDIPFGDKLVIYNQTLDKFVKLGPVLDYSGEPLQLERVDDGLLGCRDDGNRLIFVKELLGEEHGPSSKSIVDHANLVVLTFYFNESGKDDAKLLHSIIRLIDC